VGDFTTGPTMIERIASGDFTEPIYDLTTGVQTGTKVKGTDIAGGNSMAMAAAIGIGSGISAIANIYGAKKAASVQEKALNQAQANLEKDAQQAEAAWGAWYERQAPVMQTRNDALMARRGQYKHRPEGTDDLFTPEFRGWPSASSQAPQGAQPQATMASVSPPESQYERDIGIGQGIREGGAGPIPMKDGGVVTQPTVALIGEAGPEAVVPLSGAGGGRMGDMGGGVMPLPQGPWGGGGGRPPMPPGPYGGGFGGGPRMPPPIGREFPPGPRNPDGPWPPPPIGREFPPGPRNPDGPWPPPTGPPRDYPSPTPGPPRPRDEWPMPPRDYPSPMPPRDYPSPMPPRDYPSPMPGPPREGPLPDRREPTREDRRRQSDRLARERRQLRQRQKGGGMTPPTDFSA
jgi:hypothetical protein